VRSVLQRVTSASVTVEGEVVSEIDAGLCALVGVERDDTEVDAVWLAQKVLSARVFEDEAGKMNRSLVDVAGELLAVSQFTLLGDLRRGRRPSFDQAMEPRAAEQLFEAFCEQCRAVVPVRTGRFRKMMQVALVNAGPVTLLLDSRKVF